MWRYAPDIDPTTPEIYTDMTRMLPTPWGTYRTCPTMVATGSGTGSNAPNGSEVFLKVDGTQRWVVGAGNTIYDSTDDGATFTSRGGAAYSPSGLWTFAQFGNQTIAANIAIATQMSTTGNFAALSGSPPKAACVCVQSNAVILANTNDGTAYTDGWYASDVGDSTNWSTGESANGRLIQTPGPIRALIAFSGRVYAFKDNSFYEGIYVGGQVKWSWRLVNASIGACGPYAVATDGLVLFFYGNAGAYIFDGVNVQKVDSVVDRTLASTIPPSTAAHVIYSYKERIFLIGNSPASFFSYCVDSGQWGKGGDSIASAAIPSAFVRVPYGVTRRGFWLVSTTYSAYTATGTDYTFQASDLKTGWIGSDEQVTNVSGVVANFVPAGDYSYNNGHGATYPARMTHKTCMTRAGTMASTSASPVSLNRTTGRFDTNASARWHEFTIADTGGAVSGLQGGMEVSGINLIVARPAGRA